jgi:hypothetical protein
VVWCVCLYVDFCALFFLFATLDPTIDEFGEEDVEEFEDNQGQATQGKPPLLVAYLNPNFIYASFPFMFISKMHCFIITS